MASMAKGEVPNGGWGWMVVFGVAFAYMFNQSLASIFGLLFGDHLTSLGHGTFGAALVMNMNCVTLNFTGILAGPILKAYSARCVSMTGSFLIAVGLILSSFARNLTELTITYGIVVGFGMGLISPATFIAVHSYFSTKRGQAVGLAMAGTGIGQMVMPHVVRVLLEWYGFRASVLIVGGLALNGLVGCALFQPVEWHMRQRSQSDEEKTESVEIVREDDVKDELASDAVVPLNVIEAEPALNLRRDGDNRKKSCLRNVLKAMDLSLFRDPVFCSITVGLSLVYAASINFSMIFPYFLQDTASLSRADTALCMSVLAASDVLSRLTLPTLTSRWHISCRSIFLAGTVLLCIVRALMAATSERWSLIGMSAVFGYTRAATVVNQNLVVSEYATRERLAAALGLNMVAKGVAVISIGQLLGWVRDRTRSYPMCMHAQNVCLAVTAVWWTAEIVQQRCRRRRTSNGAKR